ncbi:MAG TPA: lysozyme, partial [Acidimicrobiales bacterium]|nr:lysozyme [Acidimicrobiales bacterium]
MGVAAERWLNRRWVTRGLPVVLGAMLVAGGAAAASRGHSTTLVKTSDAEATADFAPASSTTTTPMTLDTSQAPSPSPAAVASPAPAVQEVATTPPAPVWRPSHPRADYMGATIASRPNAFIAPGVPTLLQAGTPGIDVSNWQGHIDWATVAAQGVRFAYIKATEATTYTDPQFGSNYAGAANAGLIRGAYHFAVPNAASGAAQANFFVDHGGGWVADGRTLPPALDIEYNPYGPDPCYGLTPSQMTSWVADFVTTVFHRTGRWPVIYTTTNWWGMCTGNSPQAGAHSRLWLASWTSSGQVRDRPYGWSSYTIWQYADRGAAPGDQDFFHGSYAQLRLFASTSDSGQVPGGSGPVPLTPPPPAVPSAPVSVPPPTSPSVPPPTAPTAPTIPPAPSGAPRLPSSSSSIIS